jgi:methionyl-tRNA formyltransferase
MSNRVVFMGSPEFAAPTLQALNERFEVAGVVTQPDRPAGRGRKLQASAVKLLAGELGLPTIQPEKLRDEEAMRQLAAWKPDLIVVAAYGQILKPEVLDLPPHGCLNVHASLLPRWRGASPIQAAILHGDEKTGVTIMKMDAGMDTGPVLSQREISIEGDDTGGSLSAKLAALGAELLGETLPAYLSGALKPQPQDEKQATYTKLLKKSDGKLDFETSAEELARKVRGYNPWPGAFVRWQGQLLKIHAVTTANKNNAGAGKTLIHEGLPAIGTQQGILILEEVQPAGKQAMPGAAFLTGARGWGTIPIEPGD